MNSLKSIITNRTNIRNAVTFAVGLIGGIYTGENLPEIYYVEVEKHLPNFYTNPTQ